MAYSSSAKSTSAASGRGAVRASCRVVSSVNRQGAEINIQSRAESASGKVASREESVFISEATSVNVHARASASEDEATASSSID